ncbi:hypothetical protein Tco_1569855, partial [Tanacetum coccineum]
SIHVFQLLDLSSDSCYPATMLSAPLGVSRNGSTTERLHLVKAELIEGGFANAITGCEGVSHTAFLVLGQPTQVSKEMLRLRDLGANTPSSAPYTEQELIAMVRKGKQRGTFPRLVGFFPEMRM